MLPFTLLRRSRGLLLPLLLLPAALLPLALAPSAQAVYFMGGTPFQIIDFPGPDIGCSPNQLDCIGDSAENPDYIGANFFSLFSAEEPAGITTWTSDELSSPYLVSFSLAFESPQANSYAFYKVNDGDFLGTIVGGPSSGLQTLTITNLYLDAGDTLTFGIDNGSFAGSQELLVSGFEATPVPAPLPLLGAGAAFGIIRRRRARLRAAAQAQ